MVAHGSYGVVAINFLPIFFDFDRAFLQDATK
jgi:hypothetical protein